MCPLNTIYPASLPRTGALAVILGRLRGLTFLMLRSWLDWLLLVPLRRLGLTARPNERLPRSDQVPPCVVRAVASNRHQEANPPLTPTCRGCWLGASQSVPGGPEPPSSDASTDKGSNCLFSMTLRYFETWNPSITQHTRSATMRPL